MLISKVSNSENSQNFYGKLVIFQIAIIDWFKKWLNIRISSIWKLINFPNLTFWKLKKNIFQFEKLLNCANNSWKMKKLIQK